VASKEPRYLLVAAVYPTMKQAEALQQRLWAKQQRAVVKIQKAGDKLQYQVRVGPFTSAKAAEDAANRIKAQEKLTPKVLKLDPKTTGADNVRRQSR
jgi:cell division protein FtsN